MQYIFRRYILGLIGMSLIAFTLSCVSTNPLMDAATSGNTMIVEQLLSEGADVNQLVKRNYTALLFASERGNTDVVKLLLKSGADVHAVASHGNSALMAASYFGHTEIVNMLLEAGSDLNVKGQYGRTSLHWAVMNVGGEANFDKGKMVIYVDENEAYSTEIISILINAGAIINGINAVGHTPLMTAALIQRKKMVISLLNAGADKSIKNNSGDTALDIAIMMKNTEIIELLENTESHE